MAKFNWEKISKENLDLRHKDQLLRDKYEQIEKISNVSISQSRATIGVSPSKAIANITQEQFNKEPVISYIQYDIRASLHLKAVLMPEELSSVAGSTIVWLARERVKDLSSSNLEKSESPQLVQLQIELKKLSRYIRERYAFHMKKSKHQVTHSLLDIGLNIEIAIKILGAAQFPELKDMEILGSQAGNLIQRGAIELALGKLKIT